MNDRYELEFSIFQREKLMKMEENDDQSRVFASSYQPSNPKIYIQEFQSNQPLGSHNNYSSDLFETAIWKWKTLSHQLQSISRNQLRVDVLHHCSHINHLSLDTLSFNSHSFFSNIENLLVQRNKKLKNKGKKPAWKAEEEMILIWLVSHILDLRDIVDSQKQQFINLNKNDWKIVDEILPSYEISCEDQWLGYRRQLPQNEDRQWDPAEILTLQKLIERLGQADWEGISYHFNRIDPLSNNTQRTAEQCEFFWKKKKKKEKARTSEGLDLSISKETMGHDIGKRKRGRPRKIWPGTPQEGGTNSVGNSFRLDLTSFSGKSMEWVMEEFSRCVLNLSGLLKDASRAENELKQEIIQLRQINRRNNIFLPRSENSNCNLRGPDGKNLYNFQLDTRKRRFTNIRDILDEQVKTKNRLSSCDSKRKSINFMESDFIIMEESGSSEDEKQLMAKALQEEQEDFSGIFD